MKFKRLAGTILLAGTLLLSFETAAAEEATSQEEAAEQPDLVNLFYTYSGDNIVVNYSEPAYIYSENVLEQSQYSGFIALKETDLNWDGMQELLAIRLKDGEEPGEHNRVMAEIYQYQGDRLQRTAQFELARNILDTNEAQVDVFLVYTDYGILICCEAMDRASLIADGVDWRFVSLSYNGLDLVAETENSIIGSSWSAQEEDAAWQYLNSLGVYPGELVTTAVADQVDNIERVCSIRREMSVSAQSVSDFLSAGDGSLQYGETTFVSYANADLENKIQSQFATALDAQEIAGVSGSDEYILADSSDRYLTEADLTDLTEEEILLARNEIYARHGRMFANAELNEYFSGKAWYQPSVEGKDFTEEYAAQVFNEYEIGNISFIVTYEKEHGLNQS